MTKKLLTIVALLLILAGIWYGAWYVYNSVQSKNMQNAELLLQDMDNTNSDFQQETPTEEEVADITSQSEIAAVEPATAADIDALLGELQSVTKVDTAGYKTTLSDI